MPHRYPVRQAHKIPRRRPRFILTVLLAAGGLPALTALAQTVYRCGNEYNDTPSCSSGSIVSVHDARSEDQHKAQDRLTQQTQAQADALEKNRIKAEKQNPRATPSIASWPAKEVSPTQDSSTLGSPTPRAHHKKTSPYFTAKDGNAKSKKTPPTTNKDTPAKP